MAEARAAGAAQLSATLAAAAGELADQTEAFGKTADLIAAAAAARAPKRRGRLAASGRAEAGPGRASVVFTVEHAPVVHWGWPARGITPNEFASDAATATETQWTDLLTAAAQQTLDTVRGI